MVSSDASAYSQAVPPGGRASGAGPRLRDSQWDSSYFQLRSSVSLASRARTSAAKRRPTGRSFAAPMVSSSNGRWARQATATVPAGARRPGPGRSLLRGGGSGGRPADQAATASRTAAGMIAASG